MIMVVKKQSNVTVREREKTISNDYLDYGHIPVGPNRNRKTANSRFCIVDNQSVYREQTIKVKEKIAQTTAHTLQLVQIEVNLWGWFLFLAMLEPHPPLHQKETGEEEAKEKNKIKISNKEMKSIKGIIS